MMKVFSQVLKFQSKLEDWTAVADGIVIVLIMVLTDTNVLGRYIFRLGVPGTIELAGLLVFIQMVIPIAYVHRIKGHIGIEFIQERVPPKAQNIMELCTLLIILPLAVIFTWQSIDFTTRSWIAVAPGVIQVPYWPFLLFLPFSFGLLTLRVIRRTVEVIVILSGRSVNETSEAKGVEIV